MQRAMWKGAISFGLINIPVELYTAEKHDELDFTMLDKRDFSPVGYKRYSKQSGKEVTWDDIVKGYEYEDGKYVLLSDEDLRRANVEATQTIDIQCFVEASEVPITYYEQPYYLAPGKGGGKAYALLRETLRKTGKLAIAKIVVRTRQHIAAILPFDNILNLITLRYPAELRAPGDLEIPDPNPKKAGISPQEVQMALTLVDSMSTDWNPDAFHDTYRDDVMGMIQQKIKKNQTHEVAEPGDAPAARHSGSNVVDLMALLKKSLDGKSAKPGKTAGISRKTAGKTADTPAKRAPAKKAAAKTVAAPVRKRSAAAKPAAAPARKVAGARA